VQMPIQLLDLSIMEDSGTVSIRVKMRYKTNRNTRGEGGYLCYTDAEATKAWVSNGIRYPSSPCNQR
jgi:hypothetical protein